MIKALAFCLAGALIALSTACSPDSTLTTFVATSTRDMTDSVTSQPEIHTVTSAEHTTTAPVDVERKQFFSLREYSEFKSDNSQYTEYFAAPIKQLPNMKLKDVWTVKDVYFCVAYTVESELSRKYQDSISNNESSSMIDFVTFLYDDPSIAFKQTIDSGFYTPLESNPNIYYWAVPAYRGDGVLHYEIEFIQDTRLIHVNIPAIYSIEEMLPYIETQMVSCFDEEAVTGIR